MSGADAFMLSMETPSAYMHTLKIAILDPSTDPEGWSFSNYLKIIESRLHLAPFCRWKYAPAPLQEITKLFVNLCPRCMPTN